MPRYKCTIEYDGSKFAGWQKQKHSPSIQEYIEKAIENFAGEKIDVTTAGRTDSGVHALGQVIHFDIKQDMDEFNVMGAINFHIKPHKIAVLKVVKVDESFNARLSAKKRVYEYRIINRRGPLTIDKNRAWHVISPLDEKAMQESANYLIGRHDFTTFRDSLCQANSPVKTLDELRIERQGEIIKIHASAKSFLHHMVRNLAGTLKLAGEGKWQPIDVKNALEAKDRSCGGPTAPAEALYLVRVEY